MSIIRTFNMIDIKIECSLRHLKVPNSILDILIFNSLNSLQKLMQTRRGCFAQGKLCQFNVTLTALQRYSVRRRSIKPIYIFVTWNSVRRCISIMSRQIVAYSGCPCNRFESIAFISAAITHKQPETKPPLVHYIRH